MSNISSWSTTAASNNSAAPDGFPEGMAPSGVNDAAREVMASVRTFYENIEWRNWGHTPTRTGNTTFTIPTDVTAIYVTDRRIQCTDATTLYGTIVSSSYSAPNTTVTVTLDSGNLSASLTAVAVGPDVTNDPIHVAGVKDALDKTGDTMTGALTMSGKSIYHANASVAAHATTSDIWVAGNYVTLTGGVVTFTDFADAPVAGVEVELYCNAAHVFTNNANLVIDGAANFTAAAGDRVRVRARSTTVFDLHPIRLSGVPLGATTAAQGASKVLISSATANGTTSSLTFTTGITSTYDVYEFELVNLTPTGNDDAISMRTSTDGGSNYDNGASDYRWTVTHLGDTGTPAEYKDAADSQIKLWGNAGGTSTGMSNATAAGGFSGTVKLYSPSSTAVNKHVIWDATAPSIDATNEQRRIYGSGRRVATAGVDAVVFFTESAGNLASGKIYMYGLKKS